MRSIHRHSVCHAHMHTPYAFNTKCIAGSYSHHTNTHTHIPYAPHIYNSRHVYNSRQSPIHRHYFYTHHSLLHGPSAMFSVCSTLCSVYCLFSPDSCEKSDSIALAYMCIDRLKQVRKQNESLICVCMCFCLYYTVSWKTLALSASRIGAGVPYIRYDEPWERTTLDAMNENGKFI